MDEDEQHGRGGGGGDSSEDVDDNVFAGMTIALTGAISLVRRDAVQLISEFGGTSVDTVTRNVTHLIAADPDGCSKKLIKAAAGGTKIVGEDWFHKQVAKGQELRKKKKKAKKGGVMVGDNDEGEGGGAGGPPKPLHFMKEGDTAKITGNSGSEYEIRLRGGVHYCTCRVWKYQAASTSTRTCMHLVKYLGSAFDEWRTGRKAGAPAPKNVKVAGGAPKLLLAKKWDENQNLKGWWMSEKLDGVRAFWDGSRFVSRLGNQFFAPDWFTKGLPKDQQLDGELFGGRKMFQASVGIVKSQDHGDKWKQLTYQIFDVVHIASNPFEERLAHLKALGLEQKNAYVRIVKQVECKGTDHLNEELAKVLKLGGEGLMMRQPKSKYVGSRSTTLLKVKCFSDAEAQVVGYNDGHGKHNGLVGSLQCVLPNGLKFQVGSGLSSSQRADPPKIGAVITFRYQELTDGGIPRFPTFVGERLDFKWPPPKGSWPPKDNGKEKGED